MSSLQRHLGVELVDALSTSRVVHLVGPRQAGKTTLVRTLVQGGLYLTLDDPDVLRAFRRDMLGHLQTLRAGLPAGAPLIIDEVQRLPELPLAIKRIVDEDPRPGQFLLTGSADVFASARCRESLAGRVTTLRLLPLSMAEVEGGPPCVLLDTLDREGFDYPAGRTAPEDQSRTRFADCILRGGFPEMRTLNERARMRRFRSYLESVVERDVSTLGEIRKADTFRATVRQLALRTACELNIAQVCKLIGIRKETANTWIEYLEQLHMIRRLPSWATSTLRTGVRAPKVHFLDTGLAAALSGIGQDDLGEISNFEAFGALLESFVHAEICKSLPLARRAWTLHHWRHDRREIDIIATAAGRPPILIEVKAALNSGARDIRHIEWFLKEGPGRGSGGIGVLLYMGERALQIGDRTLAIPLQHLWRDPSGGAA